MTRFKDNRGRLKSLLAVAGAAVAIVALPGLASARDDSSDSTTTIKSFDPTSRALVLSLPGGETLSGVVGRRTKIRCEDQRDHRGRHGRDDLRGREAEPGDDRGGREAEVGDDRGGDENEAGDDNGGGDSSGPGPSGSGTSGHDDSGSGANCSVADLVPGAVVDEVELDFERGSVHFDEIELDD